MEARGVDNIRARPEERDEGEREGKVKLLV